MAADTFANDSFVYNYFDDYEDDDTDSIISLEEQEYPIEKIIAEITCKNKHTWYLVKWHNSPLHRSSWECDTSIPQWVLDEWSNEKQRQAEGKSKPVDLKAFENHVKQVEEAQKSIRRLKHFKKQAEKLVSNITAS